MAGIIQVLIIFLGLTIGSFLGLCIARIPRGESVVYPPSRCDACGRRLGPVELLPVLGYLIHRGRCRHCGAPVPRWYPELEVLTAAIYLSLWQHFGLSPLTIKYAFLASLLLVIAGIDLQTCTIPDPLVWLGLAAGLVFLPLGEVPWSAALLGAGLGGGLLLLIAVLSRGGMGGGDVKVALVMGLFLGWPETLLALFLAVLAGAVVGLMLMLLEHRGRRDPLPFTPFLALGTMSTIWWGTTIINWYTTTFF
ncbi:prepilin peptidase [Moorella naiadis]|uniref:prepilin peptidase n=1 Tax=Moorella naiadis (nom. illeg.) TaxID=3093670 RepID=UPI003D9CB331